MTRRAWPPGENRHPQHRIQKRLFTPEIKRMLKDWLVRRRENPYPSRDEKKTLALNSGLTYIQVWAETKYNPKPIMCKPTLRFQICNWFANWRRKLKNAGREPAKKTWGHLIKSYNTSANGNVEQFSICSGDSIWGDEERSPLAHNITNQHHSLVSETHLQTNQTASFFPESALKIPVGQQQPYVMEYFDRFGVPNKSQRSMVMMDKAAYNSRVGFFGYASSNHFENAVVTHRNSQDGSNAKRTLPMVDESQEQCFHISSTTQSRQPKHPFINSTHSVLTGNPPPGRPFRSSAPSSGHFLSKAKYKNNIMEKYLRDLTPAAAPDDNTVISEVNSYRPGLERLEPITVESNAANNRTAEKPQIMCGRELSKWLESAANFTPDKNNYIEWETSSRYV